MATATGRYGNLDRSFKLSARSLLTAFSREVGSLPTLLPLPLRAPVSTLENAGLACACLVETSGLKRIRRSYMLLI
jgi:hypothetical protein